MTDIQGFCVCLFLFFGQGWHVCLLSYSSGLKSPHLANNRFHRILSGQIGWLTSSAIVAANPFEVVIKGAIS